MSKCTDYKEYTISICNTKDLNGTTVTINYTNEIDLHNLLDNAKKILNSTPQGMTHSLEKEPNLSHRNSSFNKIRRLIKNPLLLEIFKAFADIYKDEQETLDKLITSTSEDDNNEARRFMSNLLRYRIKTTVSVSGGFFGFCRGKGSANVNSTCVISKQNSQENNPMIKIEKIKADIKDFLTMNYEINYKEDHRLRIQMLKNIHQVISERKNASFIQNAGGPPTGIKSGPSSTQTRKTPHSISHSFSTPNKGPGPYGFSTTSSITQNIGSNSRYTLNPSSKVTLIQPYNTYANSLPQNTIRPKLNANLNDLRVQDVASFIQETHLQNEIEERITILNHIGELLSTEVQVPGKVTIQVGKLLLIDAIDFDRDIKTLLSQSGGGNSIDSDLVTSLYAFDIKIAKYEQLIAYKTYVLYSITLDKEQYGGGPRDILRKIHEHFTSYSFTEKINALQSLGKSLLVYVFKRVAVKLKLPEEIAQLSVVEDANEYFDTLAKYIRRTYDKAHIIQRKYDAVKIKDKGQQQKALNEINIDVIEGLISFATIITIFRDANFANTTNLSNTKLDDLDFLLSKLKGLKDLLANNSKDSVTKSIKSWINEFKKSLNPRFYSAAELSQHKEQATEMRSIRHTIRGEEATRLAMEKEPANSNAHSGYEDHHDHFLKKMSDDVNKIESSEVTEIIDISSKLLNEIANTFTANHLTEDQLAQLKEASSEVIDKVMKTGFVRSTLEGFKSGFSQFMSSVPWIDSVIHILKLLAPYATTIGQIATYTNPIGLFLVVINLSIVALHYLVRLSIFFWKKYANKDNFKVDEFLSELNQRTDKRQKGGRQIRFVSAKEKSRMSKRTMKGAGPNDHFLPSIVHPKSSIQQVHDRLQSSLPSITGVKLPLITKTPTMKVSNTNDSALSVEVQSLDKIAKTIVYDISQFPVADTGKNQLTPDDISNMASALEVLITSDTVDIDIIYGKTQNGGKSLREIRHLNKKLSALKSQTKQELFAFAKAKRFKVKSTDKKDDIIRAIIQKKK